MKWRGFLRFWRRRFHHWLNRKPEVRGQSGVKVCRSCGKLSTRAALSCQYCKNAFEAEELHRGHATLVAVEREEPLNPAYFLFGACVFLYVVAVLISLQDPDFDLVGRWWSPKVDALAILGANQADLTLIQGQYWRLFTHIFLHDSLIHIFLNLSLAAYLGTITFKSYNSRRFWLLVLAAAFLGGTFSVSSVFLGVKPFYSTGFSAVLFGFLGANVVHLKVHHHFIMADRMKQLLIWSHVLCLMITGLGILNIDNFAHLGGMLAGLALGWWFESESARLWGKGLETAVLLVLILPLALGVSEIVSRL